MNTEDWKAWFKEQADLAGAKIDRGLYISLRLDGRVRGSGLGPPPWQRLIAQLPKAEGERAEALLVILLWGCMHPALFLKATWAVLYAQAGLRTPHAGVHSELKPRLFPLCRRWGMEGISGRI